MYWVAKASNLFGTAKRLHARRSKEQDNESEKKRGGKKHLDPSRLTTTSGKQVNKTANSNGSNNGPQ